MFVIATPEDRDLVLKFLDKTLEISKWKMFHVNMDKGKIVDFYLDPKTNDERIVLFIFPDETITGLPIGMFAFDTYSFPDSDVKIARIRTTYLEEEFRGKGLMDKALDAFHYWAKNVAGASYTDVGSAQEVNLEKHGYKLFEVLYMKDIR